MTTVHQVLGSPVDRLLEFCTEVWVNNQAEPLTGVWKDWIRDTNNELAGNGSRVLGIDFRPHLSPLTDEGRRNLEQKLIFIGLVGMSDPVRPDTKYLIPNTFLTNWYI